MSMWARREIMHKIYHILYNQSSFGVFVPQRIVIAYSFCVFLKDVIAIIACNPDVVP